MRIKLVLGKQKELIKLAKEDKSWRELATILKINTHYLYNELNKERRLLSEKIYYTLCKLADKKWDKFILERLDDNWGKVKGGSKNSKKFISCEKWSRRIDF